MTNEELILAKLEKLEEQLVQARLDIATLKVKSGVWGLLGGLVPVLIMIAVVLVERS